MKHIKSLFLNDHIILSVIAVNAFTLFLQSFDALQPWHLFFENCDHAFTLFFVVEIIVKLRHFSAPVYFQSGWHKFDFVMVALSAPSLLLFLNIPDLSFILVLRLARIFKFFRFIEAIPNIGPLLESVRRAFKASVFVLLALLVYNFVLSILTCHMFRHLAPQYFGDPLLSMFSIFRIFTLEGWSDIPEAIAANGTTTVAFLARAYFVVIVLTGGVLGLSVINALFVDEITRDNTDPLEAKVDLLARNVAALMKHHNLPVETLEKTGTDNGETDKRE